jgi:uncharacterized protein YlxW (UPF0749 family)
VVLSDKEALVVEVRSLQVEVESYRDSTTQLQAKVDKLKSKYSSKKKYSDDKLASSM